MAAVGSMLAALLLALVFQRRFFESSPEEPFRVLLFRLGVLVALPLGIVVAFSMALETRDQLVDTSTSDAVPRGVR